MKYILCSQHTTVSHAQTHQLLEGQSNVWSQCGVFSLIFAGGISSLPATDFKAVRFMTNWQTPYFFHSFHWHNAMNPCHSQKLLPFLSVIYPFLPPFSTN